jgi:hypothetical protein
MAPMPRDKVVFVGEGLLTDTRLVAIRTLLLFIDLLALTGFGHGRKSSTKKLQVSDLTTDRKWRAVTGTNKDRFEKLLFLFTVSYLELQEKRLAERQADGFGTSSTFNPSRSYCFYPCLA